VEFICFAVENDFLFSCILLFITVNFFTYQLVRIKEARNIGSSWTLGCVQS
jgi:hypothetical protein